MENWRLAAEGRGITESSWIDDSDTGGGIRYSRASNNSRKLTSIFLRRRFPISPKGAKGPLRCAVLHPTKDHVRLPQQGTSGEALRSSPYSY